ncbi:sigma-70 family RNA polymerase sigma factor [candidate division KSB1 bacterium]|nr:sigma-70 family RNA polymerase sigma factor [candidate division KSB1 bacterium]
MERDEELLIYNAQHGNQHSFEILVQRYDRKILNLILSMVDNEDDAQDIYQEIFIRVFNSLNQFKYQSQFYTWLFRIAINTIINHRKRISSIRHSETIHDGIFLETFSSNTGDPEKEIINNELDSALRHALSKLSPQLRAVFTLRHYDGLKLVQIADLLSCSEGTIKKYLFRATHKLQHELRQFYED